MTERLFALGRCLMTPGAMETLQDAGLEPSELLARHVSGDWGNIGNHDVAANREALKHGLRVFSSYVLPGAGNIRAWVITEADRSCTTILLPEEY